MRWKNKIPPKPGDVKTKRKICLTPILASDGYWYWLETVVIGYVYTCATKTISGNEEWVIHSITPANKKGPLFSKP